ncbi:MAG: ABC transporter permease subunit [Firmicutes bacterium]|nr:ABC transporter permease subunit [Bacillota bacterium]
MSKSDLSPKTLKPIAQGRSAHYVMAGIGVAAMLALLSVVLPLAVQGLPRLNMDFLFKPPRELGGGGIGPEILNTLIMVGLSQCISLPLAIIIAIYRVEYDHIRHLARLFDQGLQIVLSLPTMVIGLIVVDVAIVRWHWPISVESGILVLSLINWPFAVFLTVQVLQRIPDEWREASRALGASRWQTITRLILPVAWADIIELTGLTMARLMGETAALIYTAGLNVTSRFAFSAPGETVAVHLWYIRTEGLMPDADQVAAATGLVLLLLVIAVLWVSQKFAEWVKNANL